MEQQQRNVEAFQRANDADVWLRHLLTSSEVKKGRLHPKFWEKAFTDADDTDDPKPWVKEASGRLASLANDVEAFATEAARLCKINNPGGSHQFRGAVFARVSKFRNLRDLSLDVFFTPRAEDAAHSDLVTMEVFPTVDGEISSRVWDLLSTAVEFATPGSDDLDRLESLCGCAQ